MGHSQIDQTNDSPNVIDKIKEQGVDKSIEIPTNLSPLIISTNVVDYIQSTLQPILNFTHYSVSERRTVGVGDVVIINVATKKDGVYGSLTRVLIWEEETAIQHFVSTESFLRFISSKELRPGFIEKLFSFNVVAGTLALTLLLAVIVSATIQNGKVDPTLGSALSLIVGFYFGQETRNRSSRH